MKLDKNPASVSWTRSKEEQADGLAKTLRQAAAVGAVKPDSIAVVPEPVPDSSIEDLARDAQVMADAADEAQARAKELGVPFDREHAPFLFRSALRRASMRSQLNDGVSQTADAEDK